MNRRPTSSATSRRPSRKSRATTTTSSKRKRKSSTTRARSRAKKSTDRSRPVYLGLGSNVGDACFRLRSALGRIGAIAPLLAVSSFYRSDPVGYREQPDFCNAVAKIRWTGSLKRLLASLQAIERSEGRIRRFPNGPREIDIDILDAGLARYAPDPVLPHPRMVERRFVLAPLAEI